MKLKINFVLQKQEENIFSICYNRGNLYGREEKAKRKKERRKGCKSVKRNPEKFRKVAKIARKEKKE